MQRAMDYAYELDGDVAHSTPFTAGPWGPMQHGGAPGSLIARTAEMTPSLTPMRIARLTIDLMRPVPIAPLTIQRTIVREGKKLQLLQINLLADGVEVTRASVLRLRREPTELPPEAVAEPMELPPPEEGSTPEFRLGRPTGPNFNAGLESKFVAGMWGKPGRASVWHRFTKPVIKGEVLLPSMRAAITGDYCNGTSSFLDFNHWTFINADLQVSLARDPVGEWILLDTQTYPGPDGGGHAFARLADRQGWFGRAGQSVIFERR
jgi:hypothetical protein